MLRIASAALSEMIEHCRREFPNEACGYLAGRWEEMLITQAIPIKSVDPDPTFYEMDSAGQLKTQKRLREKKMDHIAVYHSHVATEAQPSPRDRDRATAVQEFFDGYYVIVTLKDSVPRARAFKIRDGHVQEEELVEVTPEGRHPRVREDQKRDSRFRGND